MFFIKPKKKPPKDRLIAIAVQKAKERILRERMKRKKKGKKEDKNAIKENKKKKEVSPKHIISSNTLFKCRTKRNVRAKHIRKRKQSYVRKYTINKMPIHSFMSRAFFKILEGGLLFSANEQSYAHEDIKHPKKHFLQQKKAFLEFSRILRYRFNIDKEVKSSSFWSPLNNFLYYHHDRYKYLNQTRIFFKRKFRNTAAITRKKRLINYQGERRMLYANSPRRRTALKLGSYNYIQSVIRHYKSAIFESPSMFDNKYSLKWGKVNSYFYKIARRHRTRDLHKYNYLYLHISIFRYLQLKSYVNKIMRILGIIIKKKFKKMYGWSLVFFKKNLFFLIKEFKKINFQLEEYKSLYETFSNRKVTQLYKDKNMIFTATKLKLRNIKDFYLSFLKRTLLKYFKLNLHFKFEKKNIFITVTNYKGDVKFRHSIGLLGYKKDKKKTYYAAKELIKYTIPRLFKIFKIRNITALQTFKSINSYIFSFYLQYLRSRKNSLYLDGWGYPRTLKLSLRTGLYKILYNTMKKYVTLRIILRGSKSKLRGLMRKVFKSLRDFKVKNKRHVSRILFLALNTKPHNGCRSPKKGRRKTKRRRQRLRIKLLNKQFEYEQRFFKKLFFMKRKQLGTYNRKVPTIFYRDFLTRDYKKSSRNSNIPKQIANIKSNFHPLKKYHFLYAGPRRKGPRHFEKYKKKYTRPQRMWKDFERWNNPQAIKPRNFVFKRAKLNKRPVFSHIKD